MDENNPSTIAPHAACRRPILTALLLLVIAIAFLCAGIFAFIRVGLPGDRVVGIAIHRLERCIGKSFSFGSAQLSWLSLDEARISLTDLKVREAPGAPLLVQIPRVVVEIRALPFFAGILQINRLELSEPALILPELGQKGAPGKFSDTQALRFPLYPMIHRLELIQGRVVLGYSVGNRYVEKILFSRIQADVKDLTLDGAESLAVKGMASSGEKTGSFDISGSVDSTPFNGGEWRGHMRMRLSACPIFPFRALTSYSRYDLPFSEGVLSGTGEATGGTMAFKAKGEFALSQALLLPGRAFRDKVPIDKAVIKLALERLEDNLHIDVSEAALPGLSLSTRATISGLSAPDATLALDLKKADLDLHKFFPLIPLNLIRNEDRERLVEAGLKGHILVTGGAWNGKVSDLLRTQDWQGTLLLDAYLDKVSGFIPGFGLPVRDATGRIRLNSDEMLFKGISLTVGSSPIVLNGWITNLQTSPTTDLFVSLTAQAEDLRPIVENRLISRYLGPWSGWINEPRGGIAVTLDLKGSLNRPNMKGRVVLEDFQCRFAGLPLPLRKVNGILRFRSSGVTFSGVKGIIGDSAAEMSGEIFPDKMDVAGEFKGAPQDMRKLNLLRNGWVVSGNIPLSLKLTGNPSAMNFSTHLDLKDNGLRIDPVIKKKPGVPLLLEASGTRNQAGVTIEEAYLVLAESRISGKATIDNEGKIVASVNLPPKGIPTNILIPITDPALEIQAGGRIDGDATIRMGSNQTRDMSVDANLMLNHVSLHLMGHKRMEGITGSVRWRGKSVNVNLERVRIGNSLGAGTASIVDIDNPKLDIGLDFSFLDTTDFTAPVGQVSHVTWGEWIHANPVIRFLARSRGTGSIKIARGKTAWRTFADFKANLEGNGGLIRAPAWQTNFADGALRGSALFDIRENPGKPLTLDFQGDHLQMERMMLSADPDKVRVEGNCLTEGHLEWKLGPGKENHGLHKTGTVEVRVHDGVIHRFEILSKIFSVVNLGSILRGRLPDIISQGLPFYRLTWSMDVFNDKWKVKDLKLLSDAARMDATGMYFSGQERMDFKVDVSPLVGLDTIVRGLFGNLITKDGKTLTATYRVRGSPEDPDVRLEYENARSEE
ncbi:MAG: AsmA-like C-terminal region-containing protein [Desulfomonilaceae bacterium]